MDLSIDYLGLSLKHPFMPGASPMCDDLGIVRRLEDAGASALVMHSLFEEQITGERYASLYHMEMYADAFVEASSFFPAQEEYKHSPDGYLEQIRKVKEAVDIPVIASLNGMSVSGWLKYAKQIEQAGADALELNVYHVSTDPQETSESLEKRVVEVARALRTEVELPLCVKLSPFFASLPNVVAELERAGINGVVVFNRFYQPDIDLELLEVVPRLHLSDSSELLLRLRWLAILSAHTRLSLGASGGIHTAHDAIKALLAGAHAVQTVSCLLKHGPEYLKALINQTSQWLETNGYHSIRQMRGTMSLSFCPDPAAFERANYMRVLNSWKGPIGSGAGV